MSGTDIIQQLLGIQQDLSAIVHDLNQKMETLSARADVTDWALVKLLRATDPVTLQALLDALDGGPAVMFQDSAAMSETDRILLSIASMALKRNITSRS
jgi:hypothetical protein